MNDAKFVGSGGEGGGGTVEYKICILIFYTNFSEKCLFLKEVSEILSQKYEGESNKKL